MLIVTGVFTAFSLASRFVARFTGFIGDALLVSAYSLVAWGFFATNQAPDTYAQNLVDSTSLTFRIPLAVLLTYSVLTALTYTLFYRKVTTYSRWMYAVRTLVVLLLPVCLLVMLAKIRFEGHLHLLIAQGSEWFGLAIATVAFMISSWAFSGITYVLEDWAATLNFASDEPKNSIPQTIMSPHRMKNILFRRQPEFSKPYTKPQQKYRRITF
jgi:hypothetical protein